jgi:exosortase/archaeosortase family protein
MNKKNYNAFIVFVVKFLLIFCVLYYGTVAVIGLAAPGGYYSETVDKYFDYVTWARKTLLHGTKFLLSAFGVETYFASEHNLRQVNGRGIFLVYECVGYGVISFWTAFVLASIGTWKRKLAWLAIGVGFLWILNICRLALLLVATNKGWAMPLGWDHHTWFNVIAYVAIFVMMIWFNKEPKSQNKVA